VSLLSPLLEVQDLDLAGDLLKLRRRDLPEREALRLCQARKAPLDEAHAALVDLRASLRLSEHGIGAEVAEMATRISAVEHTLYAGTVRVSKELMALQEEIRLLRQKQSGLEEQEMELLEEIDRTETEMAENRALRKQTDAETDALTAAIRGAEAAIDAELALLGEQRRALIDGIPPGILAEYERLRTRERLAGRAAVPLRDGSCGGCRMKLPVLEYNQMKARPEDALLCCVHCSRVLVR
jgi:predicted  nucleic acid-binding Zn-ribbon protein